VKVLRIGCIADGFTGALDVANSFARVGMRTVLAVGVTGLADDLEADAIVVALKSRTIPADEAIRRKPIAHRMKKLRDEIRCTET
jgi:uncharacterized protein YgbK (DUF1537 family)